MREVGSLRFAVVSSIPLEARASEGGEVMLRVMPRIFHSGKLRKWLATEPP